MRIALLQGRRLLQHRVQQRVRELFNRHLQRGHPQGGRARVRRADALQPVSEVRRHLVAPRGSAERPERAARLPNPLPASRGEGTGSPLPNPLPASRGEGTGSPLPNPLPASRGEGTGSPLPNPLPASRGEGTGSPLPNPLPASRGEGTGSGSSSLSRLRERVGERASRLRRPARERVGERASRLVADVGYG